MGMWDFVKDAGKALWGGDEAAEPKAEAIVAEVEKLGLDTGSAKIAVSGDKVVITGHAPTPEAQEKLILAAGNVAGVAKVEAEVKGEEPVFHTVAKGDTLSAIAKKTLGNANAYMKIFEANRPMLSHPDKIYPGQKLRIPKG